MAKENRETLISGMLFALPEEEWKSIGVSEEPSISQYIDIAFDLYEEAKATKLVLNFLVPFQRGTRDSLTVANGNIAAKRLIKALKAHARNERDYIEREALKAAILQTESIIEYLIAFEQECVRQLCTAEISESGDSDAISLEELEMTDDEVAEQLKMRRSKKYQAIAMALTALFDIDPRTLFEEAEVRDALKLLIKVIEKFEEL